MKESSETEGDGGRRDSLRSDSERQSRKELQEEFPSREQHVQRPQGRNVPSELEELSRGWMAGGRELGLDSGEVRVVPRAPR